MKSDMKRLPPPREYALLTFDQRRAIIEDIKRLLRQYAETERPTT